MAAPNLTLITNPTLFTAPVPLFIVLGSAYNYTPLFNQAALNGSEVYRSTERVVHTFQSSAIARYRFVIDPTAGDFLFGEILFRDAQGVTLMVGTLDILAAKKKQTPLAGSGNTFYLDIFLDLTGGGVQPFGQLLNTSAGVSADFYSSVELLPSPNKANGNFVLATMPPATPTAENDSMACYVSSDALFRSWSFDKYTRVCSGTFKALDTNSFVLKSDTPVLPTSVGQGAQYIIQFDNPNYPVRICTVRRAPYATIMSNLVDITFDQITTTSALMNQAPTANDPTTIKYKLYQMSVLSAEIATFFRGITVPASQLNAAGAMTLLSYVRADGSVPMTGPLNMGLQRITSLGEPVDLTDASTKNWANTASSNGSTLSKALTNKVTEVQNSMLPRDGSKPMANNLNAGQNTLVNLKAGTAGSDGVNVAQVDRAMPVGSIVIWETAVPIPTGWSFLASASFASGYSLIKRTGSAGSELSPNAVTTIAPNGGGSF